MSEYLTQMCAHTTPENTCSKSSENRKNIQQKNRKPKNSIIKDEIIRLAVNFSVKTVEAKRQWNIFRRTETCHLGKKK